MALATTRGYVLGEYNEGNGHVSGKNGNDVSAVEIKDNELVCAYDDGEREEVYNLDHAKSVIVEINR